MAKLFKTRFRGVAELKAQGVRMTSVNVLLGTIIIIQTLRLIFLSSANNCESSNHTISK